MTRWCFATATPTAVCRPAILEDPGSGLDGRLYAVRDPNFNVVAVTTDAGTVEERYAYQPYGEVIVRTAAFDIRGSTAYDWRYRLVGRPCDLTTGIYYYRARYYDPALGRFLTRDPQEYGSLPNLYAYVRSAPLDSADPTGKVMIVMRPAGAGGMPWYIWRGLRNKGHAQLCVRIIGIARNAIRHALMNISMLESPILV